MRCLVLLFGALLPLVSGQPVTVLAAASLTEVLTEVGKAYEAAHPGTSVRLGFGASSQLRLQLQQGLRAQVFASADEVQMDILHKEGRVGTPRRLAGNHLALIARKGGPVRAWIDLAKPGVRFVMSPAPVPIGVYTEQLLEALGREPGIQPGFSAAVRRNVVSREANVRQLRVKVELGEADAAIVYATDTRNLPQGLGSVSLPVGLQPEIRVTIANLDPAGAAFVAYATGPQGRAHFQRFGFK